jgi:hypothetical protein
MNQGNPHDPLQTATGRSVDPPSKNPMECDNASTIPPVGSSRNDTHESDSPKEPMQVEDNAAILPASAPQIETRAVLYSG